MLVQIDKGNSSLIKGKQSVAGILDSPTLARVERAMLRHPDADPGNRFQRIEVSKSLLSSSSFDKDSTHAIKKGLLWQQRDKLFSRWKERYFILTKDYLHCFRRASGADRISEMGQFSFKIKLVDVERVDWENKRTYSTVVLVLGSRGGKIFLRAPEGLEDWFELLEECTLSSKERRKALRVSSRDEKSSVNNKDQNTLALEEWLSSRRKLPLDAFPADSVRRRECRLWSRQQDENEDEWDNNLDNRLSLLTDIDINSYDDDSIAAPSLRSFRLNQDVFCIQPNSTSTLQSSKSNSGNVNGRQQPPDHPHDNSKIYDHHQLPPQLIKYRERSYSDMQRMDRRLWRSRINDRLFQ